MANLVSKNVQRQSAVEGRAIQQMRHQVISVRLKLGVAILLQSLLHALINIPIRPINRDMTNAVPMLFKECAEVVPLFRRIPLFQGWVSENCCAVVIGCDDWLIAKKSEE